MRSLCSERFAAAFAPKTHTFGTKVIKAFAIPGVARLAVGSDIIDTLRTPRLPFGSANAEPRPEPLNNPGLSPQVSISLLEDLEGSFRFIT